MLVIEMTTVVRCFINDWSIYYHNLVRLERLQVIFRVNCVKSLNNKGIYSHNVVHLDGNWSYLGSPQMQ